MGRMASLGRGYWLHRSEIERHQPFEPAALSQWLQMQGASALLAATAGWFITLSLSCVAVGISSPPRSSWIAAVALALIAMGALGWAGAFVCRLAALPDAIADRGLLAPEGMIAEQAAQAPAYPKHAPNYREQPADDDAQAELQDPFERAYAQAAAGTR